MSKYYFFDSSVMFKETNTDLKLATPEKSTNYTATTKACGGYRILLPHYLFWLLVTLKIKPYWIYVPPPEEKRRN